MPSKRDLLAMLVLAAFGALCIWLSSGCDDIKQAGGEVGGTLAEWIVCPTGLIDCGHVYECTTTADNPLGHVELCIEDDSHDEQLADIEAAYGSCEPTPRHEGLCAYCCGSGCGRGANAFNGCWCP